MHQGSRPMRAGLLTRTESLVQFVEQCQSFLRRAAGSEGAEAGLRIKLRQADRGQLLHQFVHADSTVLGELAQPGVFVIR